jgi:hypothetical protein
VVTEKKIDGGVESEAAEEILEDRREGRGQNELNFRIRLDISRFCPRDGEGLRKEAYLNVERLVARRVRAEDVDEGFGVSVEAVKVRHLLFGEEGTRHGSVHLPAMKAKDEEINVSTSVLEDPRSTGLQIEDSPSLAPPPFPHPLPLRLYPLPLNRLVACFLLPALSLRADFLSKGGTFLQVPSDAARAFLPFRRFRHHPYRTAQNLPATCKECKVMPTFLRPN